MRFFARILSVIIALAFFIQLSIPVLAASTEPTATTSFAMPQSDPGVPNDVHTLTQGVILGMLSFVTCALSGVDITYSDHRCIGYNAQSGKLGYLNNSAGVSGMLVGGIAATFTKPLQITDYVHYLASNFGIAKQALAADNTGFSQLSPMTSIWITMRNVAYVLFVIVFVGIGFAIMLRAKIDPRTVMTIENQIPKLIVALILISFSFAIAGLMVDLMWVLIFVVINLFSSLDPQLQAQVGSITKGVGGNPFSLANSINSNLGFLGIATQAAGAVKDIANTISISFFSTGAGQILKYVLLVAVGLPVLLSCSLGMLLSTVQNTVKDMWVIGWFAGLASGNAGPSGFGSCLDGGLATITSTIGGIIAFLIFTFAIVFALAKLWWTLIKSYALFLVYVIFAPLMIMAGVLPGSKINFENWIRHIAAYLFVFPTTVGILLVGKVIMDVYSKNTGFVPPLIGVDPKVSQALGPIMGFAIIMLLPQALTIVQDALAAPDIKYLPGIGAMVGAGSQAYTTLVNQPWKRLTRPYDQLRGLSEGPLRKWVMNTKIPFARKTIREYAGEREPGK